MTADTLRAAEEARIAADKAEKARIEAEEREAKRQALQARVDRVNALGGQVDLAALAVMPEDEFGDMVAKLEAAQAAVRQLETEILNLGVALTPAKPTTDRN